MIVEKLAIELADLTPEELDAFVFEAPYELSYSSQLDTEGLERLARNVLEHESLGDAMSRVERYRHA
jgi:hypothetical protein